MRNALLVLMLLISCLNVLLFTSKLKERRQPQLMAPPRIEQIRPFQDSSPIPHEPERDLLQPATIEPVFIEVQKYRQGEDSIYGDIMSHSKQAPFGDGSGRSTNAHETTHGINSEIRNSHRTTGKVNGFYVGDGKGVVIPEPNMRKSRVAEFLPQSLRSYRFGTYITGQQAWDDTPLYIFDEWVAYVNGGRVCVEDVQKGRHKGGWTDGVSGCLDFSIYSIAVGMAVEKYDPEYWKSNTQFRNFLIWHLKSAHETYKIGSRMKEFTWDKQDKLLNEFLTNSEAEPMRRFVRENLQGVWLDQ